MRVISEPSARARFKTAGTPAAEWQRKVRTVRRGLAVLSAYTDLLHPRHGRAALALWGHKVARFTSPFALVLALAVSFAGAGQPGIRLLLIGQLAAYGLAGMALGWPVLRRWRLLRIAAFFVLVNASMLVAWFHHWGGTRVTLWEPTRR
jgi:hypothetical protein